MTSKRTPYMESAERELARLYDEVERLKQQIREGNERFRATVEAVVEERLERCQGCGEVSARTLLCRSCTLAELEDHPNTMALRDLHV